MQRTDADSSGHVLAMHLKGWDGHRDGVSAGLCGWCCGGTGETVVVEQSAAVPGHGSYDRLFEPLAAGARDGNEGAVRRSV